MTHRFLLDFILLFLFPGVFSAFLNLGRTVLHWPQWLSPFLIGTVLGAGFDLVVCRKVFLLDNFRHELSHAFTALLFLKRVDRFVVTRDGGEIYYSGGFGGVLAKDVIGLAPYTIPTFYFISVLVRPFLGSGWFPWFDLWVGFAFGSHLWGGFRDVWLNFSSEPFIGAWSGDQTVTDIAKRGFVFSFIYIITVNLAIHGVLIAVMLEGFRGVLSWWQHFWVVTQETIELVPRLLRPVM